MLFTVDEASALRPTLAQNRKLWPEYKTYDKIVKAFAIWFFILTTIRSAIVSTVIVSMFNQEPDLMVAWNKGEGIGFFLLYLFVICLPVIGNFVNLIAPIAVTIAAFATGDGISSNFVPFVLPIAITYVATFGLIFVSNCLINSIIKSVCPKVYKEIEFLSEADEFTKMYYISNLQAENNNFNTEENNPSDAEEAEVIDEASEESEDDNEYYDDTL